MIRENPSQPSCHGRARGNHGSRPPKFSAHFQISTLAFINLLLLSYSQNNANATFATDEFRGSTGIIDSPATLTAILA